MGYKNPKLVTEHCFVSSFWSMFLVLHLAGSTLERLLRVAGMLHADWLICLVWTQDGGVTTNLLRDKLRV